MKINDELVLSLGSPLDFCLTSAAFCGCSRSSGTTCGKIVSVCRIRRCRQASSSSTSASWARSSTSTRNHRWRWCTWKIYSLTLIFIWCCFWSYCWVWVGLRRHRYFWGDLFSLRSYRMNWSLLRLALKTLLFWVMFVIWVLIWWCCLWGSSRRSKCFAFRCLWSDRRFLSTALDIFSVRWCKIEGGGRNWSWHSR